MPKMKIRKGDTVEVLTGKDKGKRGEVLRALPEDNKDVVEGVAMVKRHMKPNAANQQGGITRQQLMLPMLLLSTLRTTSQRVLVMRSGRTAPRCAFPSVQARSCKFLLAFAAE